MATNKRLIKSNDEGGGVVPLSFNTVTYDGNNGVNPRTDVGFQPDLVWIKNRDISIDHFLTDSVRGAGAYLSSNLTAAEDTTSRFNSFDSNGFTVSTDTTLLNNSSYKYVAWCWKAGGAAVTNPEGNTASQISANPDAGFSIVTHTSGMTSSNTFGHGLNSTPKIVISKVRNISDPWWVFMPDVIGSTNVLELNATAAARSVGLTFNANDTTFNIQWTSASYNFLHYCFAEVAGFSKFGSYTGISGGVTIDVGFEPAFVMVKCTNNAESWAIIDNKRTSPAALFPPSSQAEATSSGFTFTFTSTGFSFPDQAIADAILNQNGYEYIYMAFANQF